MEVLYSTTGISSGDGRDGRAALADGSLELTMAPPAETGGKGGGSNPEQLFALGYAACLHSALKVSGGRLEKKVAGSTVKATVTIGRDESGYSLAVELSAAVPGLAEEEVRELLEAAHEICPYSKATRGNILVTLTVG
ncbi:MAG TPA: organic hydroperoxide resistance protein [Solirubrobacteraceae bacterium]|nr:organic hydroperoxide resistance protein [Solirubrobacteraceae bacterium]